ncbi:hypothetical protein BD779DRAFT_1436743, partial [Infundibulicybe gibba]
LARAFQDMLKIHGLQEKILAFNGDNATSNDKQTCVLASLSNSFDEVNRVRCFNHTMQLSVKALLKPFSTAIQGSYENSGDAEDSVAIPKDGVDSDSNGDDNEQGINTKGDDDGEEEEEDEDGGDEEDEEEEEDPLEVLDEGMHEKLLQDTAAVRTTLSKARSFVFHCIDETNFQLDPQAIICNHQLNNNHPSSVARCLCREQTPHPPPRT